MSTTPIMHFIKFDVSNNFELSVLEIMRVNCIKDFFSPAFKIMFLSHKVRKRTFALRKQTYSNILKISYQPNESFQMKILIFFIFLLKT